MTCCLKVRFPTPSVIAGKSRRLGFGLRFLVSI